MSRWVVNGLSSGSLATVVARFIWLRRPRVRVCFVPRRAILLRVLGVSCTVQLRALSLMHLNMCGCVLDVLQLAKAVFGLKDVPALCGEYVAPLTELEERPADWPKVCSFPSVVTCSSVSIYAQACVPFALMCDV